MPSTSVSSTSTSVSSSDPGRTAGRNGFLASALNVTTLVSIFVVAIFAVVTQLLVASGAVSLSTTLQLTMWLVALGFIVVLAIAYMFFRVFERVYENRTISQEDGAGNNGTMRALARALDANGQRDKTRETQAQAQRRNDAQERAQLRPDARSPRSPTDGPPPFILGWSPDGGALKAEDAWVPPDELRHLGGSAYSVSTEEVFPDGCYLVPDSITLVSDKLTGKKVYECRVVDRNPALKDRAHDTVVKILANEKPSEASMPRFGRVEFEDLTITPYVTDRNPMWIRYSLRATGLHPAAAPTERELATWSAPRGVPSEEAEAHVSTDDAQSGGAGTS
jgi:membrane protein implicated in regulation of membrane protease activity